MSSSRPKFHNASVTPNARDSVEPGQVKFDDRGNAVYEWSDADLTMEGEVGDRLRSLALEHPGLSLLDEAPASNAIILVNEKAARIGYNPYESGLIKKNGQKKKPTDLRALSKWIEMQKKEQEKK